MRLWIIMLLSLIVCVVATMVYLNTTADTGVPETMMRMTRPDNSPRPIVMISLVTAYVSFLTTIISFVVAVRKLFHG